MKRVLLFVVGALLVTAPVFAQTPAAKPAGKTMSASGTVSTVTADSLTVKGKAAEWTFAVDKETKITISGATKKTASLKDAKKPTQITEFVKTGDSVTVQYHDGATKHAAEVLVRSSVKK
jgi:hypothetical protein